MIPNRLTIFPDLSIRPFRNPSVELKLARDDRLREITFADEIGNNVNFANRFWIEQKQRVAQARLLFPKRALHFRKDFPTPNLLCMRQRRCARVGIYSRAMRDNQKPGVVGSHRTNLQQPAVSASPTATDEPGKSIRQAIAMKKVRAVWTLVAKAKYSATGGSDGQSERQSNRWQKTARSDAEASREKLLQRTHELRRERSRDHQHGFALAGQFVGEGKEARRRGGLLQRNFHARV